MPRINRTLRLAGVALLAACVADDDPTSSLPPATRTNFVVLADHANPNFTVLVNGQAEGNITSRYSGSLNCFTLLDQPESYGAVISFAAFLGENYLVRAVHGDGSWWQWDINVDQEAVEQASCWLLEVPAPGTT